MAKIETGSTTSRSAPPTTDPLLRPDRRTAILASSKSVTRSIPRTSMRPISNCNRHSKNGKIQDGLRAEHYLMTGDQLYHFFRPADYLSFSDPCLCNMPSISPKIRYQNGPAERPRPLSRDDPFPGDPSPPTFMSGTPHTWPALNLGTEKIGGGPGQKTPLSPPSARYR